jgi:DNA-binding transcriptional LysR family regulator
MKYRITDIRNFVETAGCSTLSQAAIKLEVSQPALSQSIKRLETDSGLVLFYRSRSGVQLTPAGRALLAMAQRAVRALNELDVNDQAGPVFAGRSISIGCHPLVAQYALPRAMARLRQEAPDYRVELRHDLSRTIQMQIQRGDIDIGVVINPTPVPDLVIRKLGVDHVRVWTRTREANHDTVFCDLHLFQTQSILKRWKNRPGKIVSSDSLELLCRLVAEGIGYGILPQRAVELTRSKLKSVATLPSYRDEICLVFRPEFGRLAAEKAMIKSLQSAFDTGEGRAETVAVSRNG